MASTNYKYDSPKEARKAAEALTTAARNEAYSNLIPRFGNFFVSCYEKGDLIVRKPSRRKEINGYYANLSYKLVTCKEDYTAYNYKTTTETEQHLSGYSGTVSASGDVTLSGSYSSHTVSRGEVTEEHQKKTATLERFVKVVPHGTAKAYLEKEARFLKLSRAFFQLKRRIYPINGKPNFLLTLLQTLLIVLSIGVPLLASNFASLLFPTVLFDSMLLPLIIAAGCYTASLGLYFIAIARFRDNRLLYEMDVRDSRYFAFLWIAPLFFTVDSLLHLLTQNAQNAVALIFKDICWVIDFVGVILLLVCLFYLISLKHFRTINTNHKMCAYLTQGDHLAVATKAYEALCRSSGATFIQSEAKKHGLFVLPLIEKATGFDETRDPFNTEMTGYEDADTNDSGILKQSVASMSESLAEIRAAAAKEEAEPKAAPTKTAARRSTAKKAAASDDAEGTPAKKTTRKTAKKADNTNADSAPNTSHSAPE